MDSSRQSHRSNCASNAIFDGAKSSFDTNAAASVAPCSRSIASVFPLNAQQRMAKQTLSRPHGFHSPHHLRGVPVGEDGVSFGGVILPARFILLDEAHGVDPPQGAHESLEAAAPQ